MLAELRSLLEAVPPGAGLEEYHRTATEDNALRKSSATARSGAFRRLREVYALEPRVPLFRALRDLWDADPAAQPLLAGLLAAARDPIFRASASLILRTTKGEPVTAGAVATHMGEVFPGRYGENTLSKIGRNIVSSWTQTGHLRGRAQKVRACVEARPTSLAYALLLGYLGGARGEALFDTLWTRLLDTAPAALHEVAARAGQAGWIEYRHMGAVTDIGFRYLTRQEEGAA